MHACTHTQHIIIHSLSLPFSQRKHSSYPYSLTIWFTFETFKPGWSHTHTHIIILPKVSNVSQGLVCKTLQQQQYGLSPWWWHIYLRILPWSGLGHKTLQQQQHKPHLGVMMNLPESPKVLVTESFHNNRSLNWWWWCIYLSLQRSWPQNPSTTEASVHGVMHLPEETPESLPCSPGQCHKTPQQQSVACKWGHLWISLALLSPPYHPYARHPSICTQTSFFSYALVQSEMH